MKNGGFGLATRRVMTSEPAVYGAKTDRLRVLNRPFTSAKPTVYAP